MTIKFSDPRTLAVFVAQLVREGVVFEVDTYCGGWVVTLTGGF